MLDAVSHTRGAAFSFSTCSSSVHFRAGRAARSGVAARFARFDDGRLLAGPVRDRARAGGLHAAAVPDADAAVEEAAGALADLPGAARPRRRQQGGGPSETRGEARAAGIGRRQRV